MSHAKVMVMKYGNSFGNTTTVSAKWLPDVDNYLSQINAKKHQTWDTSHNFSKEHLHAVQVSIRAQMEHTFI